MIRLERRGAFTLATLHELPREQLLRKGKTSITACNLASRYSGITGLMVPARALLLSLSV